MISAQIGMTVETTNNGFHLVISVKHLTYTVSGCLQGSTTCSGVSTVGYVIPSPNHITGISDFEVDATDRFGNNHIILTIFLRRGSHISQTRSLTLHDLQHISAILQFTHRSEIGKTVNEYGLGSFLFLNKKSFACVYHMVPVKLKKGTVCLNSVINACLFSVSLQEFHHYP